MIIWSENGYKLYKTRTYRCLCYRIETEQTHVLIDTSMRFERHSVAKSIRKARAKKIDAIFLTHSHTDHVANAKYFVDAYQCKVYISPKGLQRVQQGSCTMPKGTNPQGKVIHWLESKIPFYEFTHFEACPQAEALDSNVIKTYLGESAQLLETPGHTEDSVSIILNHAVAIVGDALVNVFGNQYPPFSDDEEAVIRSWKALLDTGCEWFFPAHGMPLHRSKLQAAYQKKCVLKG